MYGEDFYMQRKKSRVKVKLKSETHLNLYNLHIFYFPKIAVSNTIKNISSCLEIGRD